MYLKERLAAGHCLVGALIYSNSPELMEYAAVGMDWIWWEAQHTHADWQNIVHGVRAAHWMKVPILVRTWTHDGGTIERLLDTGAEGVIVPMVNTAKQAEEIVSHCYFPPLGNRSRGSARMARIEPDTDGWNRRTVTIMMIETPEAVQNAEAIVMVPGVDGLLIGAWDLALRLGKASTAYTAHDSVKQELDHVAAQKAARDLVVADTRAGGQAHVLEAGDEMYRRQPEAGHLHGEECRQSCVPPHPVAPGGKDGI